MFIKCDTIKIRCNYKYLKEMKIPFNIQYNQKKNKENGRYFNSKYSPDIPYNVYIATNNQHQTLEIEFSSKILKERYPELISRDTIRQCLENLNSLGICTIDVEGVLHHGWVIRADITKDVELMLTDEVLNALNQNVGNYKRFNWEHYSHKGITFTKDVMYGKEQLKVYNKYKELLKQSYKFVDTLTNRNQIMDYFYGKTRFEITLKSEDQIKERLGVGTGIYEFFSALDTPIRDQFDIIFDVTAKVLDTSQCKGHDDWAMAYVLDAFNGDLKQIEQTLRIDAVFSSRNGLSKRMKKYQSLKLLVNRKENEIIKQVRNLL
jgi:hypothetical protein